MTLRPVVSSCAAALILIPMLALAEPGTQMQMTTTMKMDLPNMPANSMPPQTHTTTICTSAKKPDMQAMVKGNKDCTISDYKQLGNTISYHTVCDKEIHMQGDTQLQMQAGGGIKGQMQMVSTSPGQKMHMDMQFDGKRLGSCDYQPK